MHPTIHPAHLTGAISALGVLIFDADRTAIAQGDTVTISWDVSGAKECSIAIGGAIVASGAHGSYTVQLTDTTTFTLHACGDGEATRNLTVHVMPVRIRSFTCTFQPEEAHGDAGPHGTTVIRWEAEYASSLEIVHIRKLGDRSLRYAGKLVPGGVLMRGVISERRHGGEYRIEIRCTGKGGTIREERSISVPAEGGGAIHLDAGIAASAQTGGVTFSVANPDVGGKPVVYIGADEQNTLSLTMTNTSGHALALPGGAPVSELSIGGAPAALYLKFGALLDAGQFENIRIAASGWTAHYFDGHFPSWGLFPNDGLTLASGDHIAFTISNIVVSGQPRPGMVTIDYDNLGDLSSDSQQPTILAQNPPQGNVDLNLLVAFNAGATIDITPDGTAPIANALSLVLSNPSPTAPIVPPDVPWGLHSPVFNLSFVYGNTPGYWALTTPMQAANIVVGLADVSSDDWSAPMNMLGANPYWTLTPHAHEILGIGDAASVIFSISNIVTALEAGVTLMYLQYANIPGYNDGFTTLQITKQIPAPRIVAFGTTRTSVDWGDTFEVTWATVGGAFCVIKELNKTVPLNGSLDIVVNSPDQAYTLVCGTGTPNQPKQEDTLMVSVPVNPPEIVTFAVSEPNVVEGESVTVTWSTKSTARCILLFNGVQVSSALSGSYTTVINADSVFTLYLSGNGTTSRTIDVGIGYVKILSFLETDTGMGGATYNWAVQFAQEIKIIVLIGFSGASTVYDGHGSLDSPITRGTFTGAASSGGPVPVIYMMQCTGRGGTVYSYVTGTG
jgi:hypothetical protein